MKSLRILACAILGMVFSSALAADWLAPASYATQFRETPDSPPSHEHVLGTDELGRDLLSRTLYGTRISLLLAPAAALLSTIIAALIGGIAGYMGGVWERCAMKIVDLVLSLPWLFLLITVRALLPLNISPITSIVVTFLMLGLLGWASSARVLCAGARSLRNSELVLQARALGIRRARLLLIYVLPNLKPVLYAQFWISIPVFILSEANLGILGLGVSEPMPSWGSLLKGLEGLTSIGEQPWKLVPLLLLILVVTTFQLLLPTEEVAL